MSKSAKKSAKGTGLSKRTQAQRDAINERAAAGRSKKPRAAKPRRVITVAGQPTRFIREIHVGARHRKDMGDLVGLAKSIDERGALLQPVVIDKDNNLIAGQRRLAAWPLSKFRREPIPVTVVDIDAIVAGEWDENAKRKDFTPSECASIARALEPIAAAAAKARQRAHGGTTHGRAAAPSEENGNAADLVAAYVGKDRKTIRRAQEVDDAAARDPEKFGFLKEQMNKTGKVNGPWKRLQNMQRGEELRQEPPPPPGNGPYRTLVIDFPWPADLDGHRDQEARGYYPYATMPIPKIVKYAEEVIAPVMHADVAVWLWIPNFHLVRGCHVPVLKALGVQGSSLLTWIKTQIGQGQRMRGATEHAILAVRGEVPVLGASQRTWFEGLPASDEHSAKPAEFFAIAEEITPASRFAYFFAPKALPSDRWDGHGDRLGVRADETHNDTHNSGSDLAPAEELSELQILTRVETELRTDQLTPAIVASLKEQKLARGSVKLKLTKAGIARLKALREAAAEQDQAKQQAAEKAARDRLRLEGRAIECGHNTFTEHGDYQLTAKCQCGWSAFVDLGAGQAKLDEAIEEHWREVTADSFRAEAAEKTAKRGSKRAKRPPADVTIIGVDPGTEHVDCRVCSDGTGLCAECVPAAEHQVSVSIDDEGWNVGECGCGFAVRFPRTEQLNLDAAIKAHWQNVVTEAQAAAESTREIEFDRVKLNAAIDEMPDLPASLRRAPAEAAE